MTLLEAPVFKGKAQDNAIQDKIDDLTRAVERLKHLQAHDTLVILKNSLAKAAVSAQDLTCLLYTSPSPRDS